MSTNFKRKEYRNRKLLDWMHGQPCQVGSPICDGQNTVPAHSNSADYGKGGSQKADDVAAAIACGKCHHWLDEGPASRSEKRFYHDRGIIRTVIMALNAGALK